MKKFKNLTWEEIKKKKMGTILYDEFDEGIRFIIMRGTASLCAYVGIPLDHPLAGKFYEDLPIPAHGGLTYSARGDGMRPKDFFWYGWDYAHSGDFCFHYDEPPLKGSYNHSNEEVWLVEDVKEDSRTTIYNFKKLMKLNENVQCSNRKCKRPFK